MTARSKAPSPSDNTEAIAAAEAARMAAARQEGVRARERALAMVLAEEISRVQKMEKHSPQHRKSERERFPLTEEGR